MQDANPGDRIHSGLSISDEKHEFAVYSIAMMIDSPAFVRMMMEVSRLMKKERLEVRVENGSPNQYSPVITLTRDVRSGNSHMGILTFPNLNLKIL